MNESTREKAGNPEAKMDTPLMHPAAEGVTPPAADFENGLLNIAIRKLPEDKRELLAALAAFAEKARLDAIGNQSTWIDSLPVDLESDAGKSILQTAIQLDLALKDFAGAKTKPDASRNATLAARALVRLAKLTKEMRPAGLSSSEAECRTVLENMQFLSGHIKEHHYDLLPPAERAKGAMTPAVRTARGIVGAMPEWLQKPAVAGALFASLGTSGFLAGRHQNAVWQNLHDAAALRDQIVQTTVEKADPVLPVLHGYEGLQPGKIPAAKAFIREQLGADAADKFEARWKTYDSSKREGNAEELKDSAKEADAILREAVGQIYNKYAPDDYLKGAEKYNSDRGYFIVDPARERAFIAEHAGERAAEEFDEGIAKNGQFDRNARAILRQAADNAFSPETGEKFMRQFYDLQKPDIAARAEDFVKSNAGNEKAAQFAKALENAQAYGSYEEAWGILRAAAQKSVPGANLIDLHKLTEQLRSLDPKEIARTREFIADHVGKRAAEDFQRTSDRIRETPDIPGSAPGTAYEWFGSLMAIASILMIADQYRESVTGKINQTLKEFGIDARTTHGRRR